MSCGRYRDLISRYVDDEVTPRQRAELLAHVQHCHECASWLARLRQTDVLLKGVSDKGPSDRVRQAVLGSILEPSQSTPLGKPSAPTPAKRRHVTSTGWRFLASALLLRFDMRPQRLAVIMAAGLLSILGLAYWANTLYPMWGYDQFGFLVAREQAAAPTTTPLAAISSGVGGIGGPVAAPNLVLTTPSDAAAEVATSGGLRIRFDQPMDRASVENALKIDPPAGGSFKWDADNEVGFVPSGDGLLPNTFYKVSLGGTARSLAGTPINGAVSWSFHTRSPYAVSPDLSPGASVSPTGTFTLHFSGPMDTAQTNKMVSLRAAGADTDLPISLGWDAEGKTLTVAPSGPMPVSVVALRVGANARTQDGQALGAASEYTYSVRLPDTRLRFTEGRISIVDAAAPAVLRYEAAQSAGGAVGAVTLNTYALPGSKLSLLGAQSHAWPSELPAGLPNGLTLVKTLTGDNAAPGASGPSQLRSAVLPQLAPGTYLVTASAVSGRGPLRDWQLLVVADRRLSLVGGSVLWASSPDGLPWVGAELSLYTPSGALLDKGITQDAGVWIPKSQTDAALAMARDTEGHLGALLLDKQFAALPTAGSLGVTLFTDMPAYYPGMRVQFRALLKHRDTDTSTPVTEQDVSIALLNTHDTLVSSLTLKPDNLGGVSGLFDLAPGILAGEYKLRVASGSEHRDFPVTVGARTSEDLSVYAVRMPTPDGELSPSTITYTVNVMSQYGAPAAGASLTGTLRINGDSWASVPVTATADINGRASLVLPVPAWAAQFNDPGLYLNVSAALQDKTGSTHAALSLAGTHRLLVGGVDMVSPSLGTAAVVQPQKGGDARLRIVSLDNSIAGDLLVVASAPNGENLVWSLDVKSAGGDVTLPLPQKYSGGLVYFERAGGEPRSLSIPDSGGSLDLSLSAPQEVAPNSALPVNMLLKDVEGQGIAGGASLFFRKVSSLPDQDLDTASDWEPSVAINAAGVATATLTAPSSPGLWYVMCEASTPEGSISWARTVVNVTQGPIIILPPAISASGDTPISVLVYNPGPEDLSTGIKVDGDSVVTALDASSQALSVPAGGWQRVRWVLRPQASGDSSVSFSFMPSSSINGIWKLAFSASAASAAAGTTVFTSGALTGSQTVGVQVPSGANNSVHLEVHATTSLLSALADAARGIEARPVKSSVDQWASALSAASSVSSAYHRANRDAPSGLSVQGVDRSLALQQIYAAQHSDGGWGPNPNIEAPSSTATTAGVLLALRRHSLALTELGADLQPSIDSYVESRGLSFLSYAALAPLGANSTSAQLDERTRAFYALALYGAVTRDDVRPLMAYASTGGDDGNSEAARLSPQGQAWLSLALWQTGDTADALAVFDRISRSSPDNAQAAAPLLEAATVMNDANRFSARTGSGASASGGSSSTETDVARLLVRTLMENRRGAGWDPQYEADALWALSRYAASESESASERPTLLLNDGPVQVASQPNNPDTFIAGIASGPLHAGTNWLKLQVSSDSTLYYSLTLSSSR